MERELYREVCRQLTELPRIFDPHQRYDDHRVVEVFLWAALHDRPVSWACKAASWPIDLRRQPRPSQSQMSRRLRTFALQQVLVQLYARCRDQLPRGFIKFIDGKPLPVGGCSKDPDARFGRGAGCVARGYKILTITDQYGAIDHWRLLSMNTPEHRAAEDLLEHFPGALFLVGDNVYDKNALYERARQRQTYLVGAFKTHAQELGHHHHSPYRVAAFELQRTPDGRQLLESRKAIERSYGNLTSFSGGLAPLPAWVRRPHRVAQWVQMKLIIDAARRLRLQRQQLTAARA